MLDATAQERLIEAAREARKRAYAPYSKFAVGAAVLCADGSVFEGCNIENSAFGPTVCAERVAMFSAVAAGHRDIRAIAVVGRPDLLLTPCGVCRQVMAELAPEAEVVMEGGGKRLVMTVRELLPQPFGLREAPRGTSD
ncbi:MAG: cytidine deaminase [Armatimonadota bacterium]|nr:cytidine deaminase [Armatimonadota bacterium]